MQCPKCHSIIDDNQKICPVCKKVILLECPNCHALGNSAVCVECGYTILTKCSKCSKTVPVSKETCPKCGFSTAISLAQQECENDDFASLTIDFGNLNKIKSILKSKNLYEKFLYKLKNILNAQLKDVEGKIIKYDNNIEVVNFNKELSLATSANKATRLALKILNAFSELNKKILGEFACPLNLTITIIKKNSENLQEKTEYLSSLKLLNSTKKEKKYLKGFNIIIDQFIRDEISRDFKTDSLYTMEINGQSIVFYEILLDSYIVPVEEEKYDTNINVQLKNIKNEIPTDNDEKLYSFKIFDINAKCDFKRVSTEELFADILTNTRKKILAIRCKNEFPINTADLVKVFEKLGKNVIQISATETKNYGCWALFKQMFSDYYKIPTVLTQNKFENINDKILEYFNPMFELLKNNTTPASTDEDARFMYMEQACAFLNTIKDSVIIFDGFQYIDDTTLQTLELYFNRYKNITPTFVFILPNDCTSLHSRFRSLLQTDIYTEYTLKKNSIDSLIANINIDATDFLKSFYYEKIKNNFNGSKLYFDNAIQFLKESNVIIEFENKLLIKNNKSVIIPNTLYELLRARIKHLSSNPNASLILAYSTILGERIDKSTLELTGVEDIDNALSALNSMKLIRINNDVIYINNYTILYDVMQISLKPEIKAFLAKTILSVAGKYITDEVRIIALGMLNAYEEEYLVLWRNSNFSIHAGDYDSYLKNCLGFLSLLENADLGISQDEIENNKQEVYNNILMSLYNYSPTKIYFIENILLKDAINKDDKDKIIRLSNLMLQGALISSNYTDAQGLMHNILSRMENPILITDGNINTKFLLLLLVNIEILYNAGDYRNCVDTANEILSVLKPDNIELSKPANFSLNSFIEHLLETFRLVGLAKIYLLDNDLEEYFENINNALGTELSEKDCLIAIKYFLADKVYSTGNLEDCSPYSKVIFLILQEISMLKNDYKKFAQNIYQAKLLATDLNQKELELFCDLLIAYSYEQSGLPEKAVSIYNDIHKTGQSCAIQNISILAKYFIAGIKHKVGATEDALITVNDALSILQKRNNQSKILFVLLTKLYLKIREETKSNINTESDSLKLEQFKEPLAKLIEHHLENDTDCDVYP